MECRDRCGARSRTASPRCVIDHPPTNLVDGAFIGALAGLLDELDADDAVRVVVFTSADPDFFLMHGDVHGILAIPPGVHAAGDRTERRRRDVRADPHRSPFVSIGVLDGAARGVAPSSSPRSTSATAASAPCSANPRSRWGSCPEQAAPRGSRTCSGGVARST